MHCQKYSRAAENLVPFKVSKSKQKIVHREQNIDTVFILTWEFKYC